jgi:hypothetical protein
MQKKEERLVGASILCFSRTPDNLLYFLLGREAYHAYYKDSHKFSDFGGQAKKFESAYDCAAREFIEETLNVVPIFLKEHNHMPAMPARNKHHLSKLLQRSFFHGKVKFRFDKPNAVHVYTTFVVEVPWMPDVGDRFQFLSKLSNQKCEKDQLRYVSPSMILHYNTTIHSTKFPSYRMRSFFRTRFHHIYHKCFPKDVAFLQAHQVVPPQNQCRSFFGNEAKSRHATKKDCGSTNTWLRAQSIESCKPKTQAFSNGFRNYRVRKDCPRDRGVGDTGRGDRRWQGSHEENQGEFSNDVAAPATHP